MGHLVGKNLYRQLAGRLDQAQVRTPWTPVFHELIRLLYTEEEARLICRLPFRPSSLSRIARMTGEAEAGLLRSLEVLCDKGLVMDLWNGRQYLYLVSPLVIGFFEFTLMRTGPDPDLPRLAELFQAYLFGDQHFLAANFGSGQRVSIMRALPHEEALGQGVEILDYERAGALIEAEREFALGLCACRHEKQHLGHASCRTPMATCTSLGSGARFLIRHGFARAIDKAQMRDILARSRDLGLTLSADNVRSEPGFICHCCGCCCNLLIGVRESGYPGILVTASVVAEVDEARCNGCGLCARACPVAAVSLAADAGEEGEKNQGKKARIGEFCLGCGVCSLRCPTGAVRLTPRQQNVLHPEDSFARVLLQSLERDTLQALLFDNPQSRSQAWLRGLAGGLLRLPKVKQALLGERLRSRFLAAMRRLAG